MPLVTLRTTFLIVSPLLFAMVLFTLLRLRPWDRPDLYWDDGVRERVQRIVGTRYIEPLDEAQERELFDAAMRGYVGTLDPFSRYFDEDERRELDEDTSGSFAGVGVQVREGEGGLLVTAVYRQGPADRAGVALGDVVTHVDGRALANVALLDAIPLIKGPDGTVVMLRLRRGDEPPRDVPVTRGVVGIDTVPSVRLLDGTPRVAYVRVAQFSENTPAEVRLRLADLIGRRGAEAIVLDLRQNLGGVVSAAVSLAGLFLPDGAVVCVTRSRDAERRYVVEPAEEAPSRPFEQPLVVLVDESSASASEILAGALQDHGRAVLVGERTYGKFLVQTLLPLSETGPLVRITTARYATPEGRSGQRNERTGARGGIVPDVRVPLAGENRRAVLQAFREQSGPEWIVLDERVPEADTADAQLRAALDLLRGAAPPAEPVNPPASERG